ncbi:MAG: T9SS type A sorting domain-containing protein [candidate division WOR-3 bacterium]
MKTPWLMILIAGFVILGESLSFRKVTEFLNADGNTRVECFDTDQDGRQNIIFGKYGAEVLQFWEHIGYDKYILEDTVSPKVPLYSIGFLDTDSLVDMVGSKFGGGSPLYVYESPSPHAHPTTIVWADSGFNGIAGGYIVDLDQDGIREILFSYHYNYQPPWWHYTCVYENTGDNQYTLVWQDTIPDASYFINGDFDQDGQIEFISSNAEGYVYVWECVGDDNYQLIFEDTLPRPGSYDIFASHDMDGNDKPEFLLNSLFSKARLYLYESIGDNIYEYFPVDSTQLPSNWYHAFSICGDIDADGIEEIVWSTCNRWHIIKATGIHQYQRVYSSDWTSHQIVELNVYDLNANGYPEVIESWYENGIPALHAVVIWEIEGVRLHQPNGGEVLHPGQQYPITWEKFDPPGADSFALFFSSDNGNTYDTIALGIPGNDTTYQWLVPDIISDSCKIMIWAYGPPRLGEQLPRGIAWDFSDSVFAIGPVGIQTDAGDQIHDASLKILQNPVIDGRLQIQYAVPEPSKVKLVIYNVLGQVEQVLVDEYKPAGIYEIATGRLTNGVYFIKLITDNKSITKKCVILKN